MVRVKLFTRLKDSKGDVNKFAHSGADDLHFVFAMASQALTEAANDWVVSFGGHCWKKECLTTRAFPVFDNRVLPRMVPER